MCDLARESGWRICSKPATSDSPYLRVDIEIEFSNVESLAEKTRYETELSFGTAICLGLVECLLIDFGAQGMGDGSAFEDLILAVREIAGEGELAEGEAGYEFLPGE